MEVVGAQEAAAGQKWQREGGCILGTGTTAACMLCSLGRVGRVECGHPFMDSFHCLLATGISSFSHGKDKILEEYKVKRGFFWFPN